MSALEELGTRSQQNRYQTHAPSRFTHVRNTRDKGMSKRVVTSLTFTASDGRVTGATNDFAAFVVGDPLVITGTALNDGERIVTAIDASDHAFLVLDFPPKDESGITCEVRTA